MSEVSKETNDLISAAAGSRSLYDAAREERHKLEARLSDLEMNELGAKLQFIANKRSAMNHLKGNLQSDPTGRIFGSNVGEFTLKLLSIYSDDTEKLAGAAEALLLPANTASAKVPVVINNSSNSVLFVVGDYADGLDNEGDAKKCEETIEVKKIIPSTRLYVANEFNDKLTVGVYNQDPSSTFHYSVYKKQWLTGPDDYYTGDRMLSRQYHVSAASGVITNDPTIVRSQINYANDATINKDDFIATGKDAVAEGIYSINNDAYTGNPQYKNVWLTAVVADLVDEAMPARSIDTKKWQELYESVLVKTMNGNDYRLNKYNLPIILHKSLVRIADYGVNAQAGLLTEGLKQGDLLAPQGLRIARHGELPEPALQTGIDTLDYNLQTFAEGFTTNPILFGEERGQVVQRLVVRNKELLTVVAMKQKAYLLNMGHGRFNKKVRKLGSFIDRSVKP